MNINQGNDIVTSTGSRTTEGAAAVLDFACVLLFVVIGRSDHHHGVTWAGVVSTAWPFAVGIGVGWILVALRRKRIASLTSGALVVIVTVATGMILRVVTGQGTAVAFIAVALAFLGLTFLGWRIIYSFSLGRRRSRRSNP